ncbi:MULTISPECIES: phage head closure protein [Bacillus]|uniref:phage head closure protein n=1 Tax=Bacillus TaxID=1386 RepID=UPI00123D29FB|nr:MULTISPECIES: phage head closure protein [Bacillus]MCT6909189.1 phage head closure protein [Bacillus cereus]MCX2467343.1 phage head closure protein [Bacillus sp. AM01]UTO44865.1 phage head closure protein [Bacillus cereus]
MNPGKRDKRIVIEHKTERKDEEGNALPAGWVVFSKAWAKAETPGGSGFNSEIFKGNAEFVIKLINFTIPYRKGVHSDMRVRYRGKLFEIKSAIDIDEKHIDLCLICEERSNWQS